MKSVSQANEDRKEPRKRALKDGKLVSADMATMVDVKIRDLSASGARVETAGPVKLPDGFSLLIVSESMIYPAITRWRKGNLIGLEFGGKPRPVGVQPAASGLLFVSQFPKPSQ
jgi:PilZ domain